MFSHKIGSIIRERREIRKLTIAKAAELCDMSDRGLSLIELGDVDPKLSSLLKIAAVLGIYLGDVENCKETNMSEQFADLVDGS